MSNQFLMRLPCEGDGDDKNELQREDYTATSFHDVGHWIDPEESVPNNEGSPDENLYATDIDFETDAQMPGELTYSGKVKGQETYIFTAPNEEGLFYLHFTGTDRSQILPDGNSGDLHDAGNTDNWWDMNPDE